HTRFAHAGGIRRRQPACRGAAADRVSRKNRARRVDGAGSGVDRHDVSWHRFMTRGVIAALAVETVMLAFLLTIAADQIAHSHVEKLGGVNIWGYRGPVLHQKKANEGRIVVTGGDLAFGWGVAASEAMAPSVRELVSRRVDRPVQPDCLVTGVTAAAQGLAPAGYASWIDRSADLRPDVICIVVDPIGHV